MESFNTDVQYDGSKRRYVLPWCVHTTHFLGVSEVHVQFFYCACVVARGLSLTTILAEYTEKMEDKQLSHLLQPIRDLCKNWDIDIATHLHDYLEEVSFIFQLLA